MLKVAPAHVDVLHFLGVLLHQRGKAQASVELIRQALSINPDYRDARLNLGNVLQEQGRFKESESEYRRLVVNDPQNVDLLSNLGAVLKQQKKLDEAIEVLEHAVALSPRHADAHHNLGNALKSAGRLEEALTAYFAAIEIKPDHSDAHISLGRALYRFGRVDEAAIVFAKWLEVDPENPIAQHMYAACAGRDTPDRASDDFVRQSFDGFAASFDEVLRRLEYQAPALVGEAIKNALAEPAAQYDMLDAGCGTGLCGKWLEPYARHLVGVDLSPRLVDKSREVRAYDELVVDELTAYMGQFEGRFDVIVSADTLVYFGQLASVFEAAVTALRPGGMLVFTLEQAPEDLKDAGFQLNPHGRYSHTRSYVPAIVATCRLHRARHL